MARKIYTEVPQGHSYGQFRIEAVKQVTENGYEIIDTVSLPKNTTT